MQTLELKKETHQADATEEVAPPDMWRIVVHADIKSDDGALVWTLVHVMRFHVGISISAAGIMTRKAMREGRAIVKENLTKEVGETIMASVNNCHRVKVASRFAFKLEQQ